MTTISDRIHAAVERYAALATFRAFAEDRIPLERFADFFGEQAMAARHFQDFIWAATEIDGDDAIATFAREHRRVDSGHYKWTALDLARTGLPPMTLDTHFALGALSTRIQLARILACFHGADRAARLVVLASLEAAGAVTLGVLHGYAARHGLAHKLLYLGEAHVRVEERQAAAVEDVAPELFASDEPRLLILVDTVFDALERMFDEGGRRLYPDIVPRLDEAHHATA
jgi:hypothetical protein